MKLLITGSTGFIGRTILNRALDDPGYEKIILLVRNATKLREQLREDGRDTPEAHARITLIESQAEHWAMQAEVCQQADQVAHCAGVLFARDPREYREINVATTVKLLRTLREGTRVVVLSSQSAGGPTPKGKNARCEKTPDQPITWYGQTKLEMERRVLSEFPWLQKIILRPPMVLGARDTATLPLFRMAQGLIRPKPGFQTKHYSFIAVNDLTEAVLSLLQVPWEGSHARRFYLAASRPIRDWDLIQTAARLTERPGLTLPIPQVGVKALSALVDRVPALRASTPSLTKDRAREIWPNRWVVDPSLFHETFDLAIPTSFEEAMRDAWLWYRQTGALR